GVVESVEMQEETVLPAAWAIEKIDALAAASHWEISPDAQQAEDLHQMMAALTPTPLLESGVDEVVITDRVPDVGQGDVELAAEPGVGEAVAEGVEGEKGEGQVDVVVHDQSLADSE